MNRTAGVIWMSASAIGFGFLVSLAEVARAGGASTEAMLFVRFLVATVCLGTWVGLRQPQTLRAIPGRTRWILFAMGAVMYFAQSYCFFHALHYVPGGALVSMLLYLYPAIVAVGAFLLFKEPMSAKKVGALVLAMGGAALAIGPVAGANPQGIAFGLGSALGYSIYILTGTRVLRDIDGLSGAIYVFVGVGCSFGLVALVLGGTLPVTAASWAACIGLGLVSVIAMGGFLIGLKILGPVNASTISALEPIVTAILGLVIWRQHLLPLQWVGGAVILGAVLWLVRAK